MHLYNIRMSLNENIVVNTLGGVVSQPCSGGAWTTSDDYPSTVLLMYARAQDVVHFWSWISGDHQGHPSMFRNLYICWFYMECTWCLRIWFSGSENSVWLNLVQDQGKHKSQPLNYFPGLCVKFLFGLIFVRIFKYLDVFNAYMSTQLGGSGICTYLRLYIRDKDIKHV